MTKILKFDVKERKTVDYHALPDETKEAYSKITEIWYKQVMVIRKPRDEEEAVSIKINTANGSKMESTEVGNVPLWVAGSEKPAILKDVLHIPELSANLMSVPAVNRKGIFVIFTPNEHVVFARDVDLSTAKTLAEGTRDKGLYWFKGTLRNTEEEEGMALLTKEQRA
ncbi:hypothetical protein HK104_003898, partial [Borealophlyctis nickersoniae]